MVSGVIVSLPVALPGKRAPLSANRYGYWANSDKQRSVIRDNYRRHRAFRVDPCCHNERACAASRPPLCVSAYEGWRDCNRSVVYFRRANRYNQQANFNTIAGTLGGGQHLHCKPLESVPCCHAGSGWSASPAHSQQWPSSANRPLKVEFFALHVNP